MDADHTFNSCSWPMEEGAALKNACTSSDWTREEDKAFENALLNHYNDANMWDKIALAVPGKTIEDLKLHYEAFIDDVGLDVIDQKERPSPKHGVQTRGTPWTEEEHRQFLYGLQRFGKGDWKSISRYSVRTKSNSQVASHAQKFFNRLSSSKDGKRLSINDIRTLNPETLLALEKATTSCMPGCCKDKSTNAGRTEEPLPGCLEKASTHAENQLLPECPKKSSADSGKQRMPRRPKRASTADGNKLLPRYPSGAPRSAGKKLLLESPEKAPTDMGDHLQPGYAKRARSETGYQLLPPPPFACMSDGSRFSSKAIRIDAGNQPNEVATNLGNQLLPPPPFAGMSHDPVFSGQSIGGLSYSASMLPTCCIPSPPFAIEPIQGSQPSIQEPGVSIETTRSFPTDTSMNDADIPVAGQFEFGCSTEFMDLDLSMFPHFLD